VSIAFDREQYFGLDDRARITVTDASSNTNPSMQEEVTVDVWSDSDSFPNGISLVLYEESPNSDVFKSIFPHLQFSEDGSDDDENVILVAEGDSIYARFFSRTPRDEYLATAEWHRTQGITIELEMPAHAFSGGDRAWLNLLYSNSGETRQVDLYVLLDVYGSYWSAPSWSPLTERLDHYDLPVPGTYQGTQPLIPEFTMPPVSPASGLFFYAAMFTDGRLATDDLVSNGAVWEFALE